jgi:hypothetical protein
LSRKHLFVSWVFIFEAWVCFCEASWSIYEFIVTISWVFKFGNCIKNILWDWMESSRSNRVEKRGYEQGVEDDAELVPGSKKPKLPALARSVLCVTFSLYILLFVDESSYFDS